MYLWQCVEQAPVGGYFLIWSIVRIVPTRQFFLLQLVDDILDVEREEEQVLLPPPLPLPLPLPVTYSL